MTEEVQSALTPCKEWPQPCPVEACGRPLYASVAYCPYCGSAKTKTRTVAAAAAPAAAVQPAADDALKTPITAEKRATEPSAPASTEASKQAEAKAAAGDPGAENAAAKGTTTAKAAATPKAAPQPPAMEKTAVPPPPKPPVVQSMARWIKRMGYTAGLLFIGLVALSYYHGNSESARKTEQCSAANQSANTALAAGNIAVASAAAQQAVTVCENERLAQAQKLLASVERVKTEALRCEQTQAQARQMLDEGRAARAAALLTRNRSGCQAPGYAELSQQASAAANEARQLVDGARSRLRAGAYYDADDLLDQALRLNADVAGVESLRKQIADARAAMEARQQRSQTAEPSVTPAPPPVATQAPAPRAAPSMDALVQGFLQDGESALQQKNYAQAKNAASSALRVYPNHADARLLLHRAERAEQEALRSMKIE